MSELKVSKRNTRRGLMAGLVLAASLSASAALAQTAPLSYAVPDSTAWSDILKNDPKAQMGRTKATIERKKSTALARQAQAKARPTAKQKTAKTVAPDEVNELDRAADVQVVAPDELNEIDRQASSPQAQ
jgi:hypothetical protein